MGGAVCWGVESAGAERHADDGAGDPAGPGDQRQSGLPVKRFCQREGLAAATFYLWKRRIGVPGSGHEQEVHFAPVRVVSQEPESETGGVIEIRLSRERCIRLHGPVDAQQLAAVVAVLEA